MNLLLVYANAFSTEHDVSKDSVVELFYCGWAILFNPKPLTLNRFRDLSGV